MCASDRRDEHTVSGGGEANSHRAPPHSEELHGALGCHHGPEQRHLLLTARPSGPSPHTPCRHCQRERQHCECGGRQRESVQGGEQAGGRHRRTG